MTNCAKSNAQKAQDAQRERHNKLEGAAEAYGAETRHPTGLHGRPRGLRKIAEEFGVDKDALWRRINGHKDKYEDMHSRTKISEAAEEQLVRIIEGKAD